MRFVSFTQLVSFSWRILNNSCAFLNPLRMKSLLPPFFLLHFHWRHTEEYTACYIQRIFPPPCWSTEGSSLCPYRSPDMLVLLYLSHCWQTLLPTDSNFVLHFHRNTNFWDFTCKKLKSYLLDIKMTQICTCVGSWESFFLFMHTYHNITTLFLVLLVENVL